MKTLIRAKLMPSSLEGGFVLTNLFSEKTQTHHFEVSTPEEVTAKATALGNATPFPCVVWCGLANRGERHPRGFKAAFEKMSRKFFPGPDLREGFEGVAKT